MFFLAIIIDAYHIHKQTVQQLVPVFPKQLIIKQKDLERSGYKNEYNSTPGRTVLTSFWKEIIPNSFHPLFSETAN